jgi:tetraacyldisaccharide 4'-kinase
MIDKIYGLFVKRNNRKYDSGSLSSLRVDIPVISIGNISAGGAGKTPLIIKCSELLESAKIKHAIVGHGYKRESNEYLLLDTQNPDIPIEKTGDEARLVHLITRKPVGVGNSKAETAHLMSKGDYRLLLVDDGFQHRKLYRDLDIVIISKGTIINPYLLPKGRLREPLTNLSRADIVILRDINEIPDIIKQNVTDQTILFAQTELLPGITIRNWATNNIDPLTKNPLTKPLKLIPMSGLARNTSFHKSLKLQGHKIISPIEFRDHHRFSSKDLSTATHLLQKYQADNIAITEKDAVKIATLPIPDRILDNLLVYPMRLSLNNENALLSRITKTLE